MTEIEYQRAIRAFDAAIRDLRKCLRVNPRLELYVAADVLCLMDGPSHDREGKTPRKDAVIASAGCLRIGGGDW